MTPSVRTLKGSKTKGFRGAPLLCPRGSNARGFSKSRKSSCKSVFQVERFAKTETRGDCSDDWYQ